MKRFNTSRLLTWKVVVIAPIVNPIGLNVEVPAVRRVLSLAALADCDHDQTVRIALDFSQPYTGTQRYMFHFHNLEHEDQGMMLNVEIRP